MDNKNMKISEMVRGAIKVHDRLLKLPAEEKRGKGQSRDKAARDIGMPGSIYSKARRIVESGNAKIIDMMDSTGKISAAYDKLTGRIVCRGLYISYDMVTNLHDLVSKIHTQVYRPSDRANFLEMRLLADELKDRLATINKRAQTRKETRHVSANRCSSKKTGQGSGKRVRDNEGVAGRQAAEGGSPPVSG